MVVGAEVDVNRLEAVLLLVMALAARRRVGCAVMPDLLWRRVI